VSFDGLDSMKSVLISGNNVANSASPILPRRKRVIFPFFSPSMENDIPLSGIKYL
jgi:hypothetical protein